MLSVFASKHPLLICFLLLQEITTLLPFSGISLDILPDSSDLGADLSDYIHHRVNGSTQVAANVTTPTGTAPDQLLLSKFSSHLSTRSHGSILYLQLTLDLFHKGHLALKGGNYLVVPVSLSEVRTDSQLVKIIYTPRILVGHNTWTLNVIFSFWFHSQTAVIKTFS